MRRPAVYFRMPRVASATITRLLQTRCVIVPHAMDPELVRHFLAQNRASFRFTFVRHPYTRFASALRWARREWDRKQHPFDEYEVRSVRNLSDLDVAKNLDYICECGPAIHFNPQTSYVCEDGDLLVSMVGRYEHLAEDFDRVADRLGSVARINVGENSHGLGTTEPPSPEICAVLDDFYAEDFEFFGYQKAARPAGLAAKEAV